MKQQPEDQVWSAITAAAKNRFDYDGFVKSFGAFDNERVFDAMLFQILSGFAEGESCRTIADHLRHDLQMLDYPFADNDFESFIVRQRTLLEVEILASKTALTLLESDVGVSESLLQIERILL